MNSSLWIQTTALLLYLSSHHEELFSTIAQHAQLSLNYRQNPAHVVFLPLFFNCRKILKDCIFFLTEKNGQDFPYLIISRTLFFCRRIAVFLLLDSEALYAFTAGVISCIVNERGYGKLIGNQ